MKHLIVISLSLILVIEGLPQGSEQQLQVGPPPPPPPPADQAGGYEPPVLQGGVGTVSDGKEDPKRRRYPDRSSSYSQPYDPGSAFRAPTEYEQAKPPAGNAPPTQPKTFSYLPYPVRNATNDNVETRQQQSPVVYPETTTQRIPTPRVGSTTRDPFNDPNRYRIPVQQENQDDLRFVNGRPYKESANVQDRYGNRYDPRFHSIPGEYDPENDPRFSDPRYDDPRNLPKYNNNRHKVPLDRYDSKYRYYERFPDRQRDRLRDPNYDPRWDPLDPPAPGVLGGWLPELQGECRPGCENLRRDITVNTNYGRVNGFLVYLYDGPRVPEFDRPGVANVDKIKATLSVFLGIPYAQPPIGEARLMPPRPHRGWQSYDAVDWAPVCPQPVRYVGATKNAPLMDEDCLYLNVYTPSVESGQSQLFPVMFYIHGGEFMHGSGNEFPGQQLAAWGKVVVVTINYRLGALGFLSTGDHHSPGNYGLLDQALALKWVYDNVNSFQGDRDKITVFGPGAGAASAGLLAIMPRSRMMVRRVIAISGSPLADWAAINDKFRAMNTSMVYGERIGCTIDSSWKLVDCIRRGRSFAELTNIEFKPEIGTWPWAPVVQKNISVPDDEWYEEWTSDDFVALPELVVSAYENQEYNPKLQYLTGVARDDAAYMIYNNKSLAPAYDIGWKFFDEMVKNHIWQYNYTLNPEGIFQAIKYMYTYYPDPNNRSHIREEFINFYSDYFFRAPQDAIVKLLIRNRVDTYMYVQNTTVEALKLPWWRQITHNLEHYFLAGSPFMDPVYFSEEQQVSRHLWTESDRNMSEFFIYAFSNFSWYGNPTPKHILGIHWKMAQQGEILEYLAVNTTENSTTLWNYRQRECAFWTEYLPTIVGTITPTYPPTTEFWWEPDSPLQIAFWSMSSVCLLLLVLVVVCCLLWRNAKRQARDRYFYEGMDSMKGYNTDFDLEMKQTDDHHSELLGPASSNFGGQMNNTGTLRSQQTQFTSIGSTMVPTMQTNMQQTNPNQSLLNGSIMSAPVFLPQPTQQQMFLNQAQSLQALNPNMGNQGIRMMSQPYIPPPTPIHMGYPTGPLPQTPKPYHVPPPPPPPPAKPSSKVYDPSVDSISSAQNFQGNGYGSKHITDSPQLSSSGRGSGRTNDSSDSGMSIPRAPTPPSEPLGIPKAHKLVPGRMTTSKERKREIPSTAV